MVRKISLRDALESLEMVLKPRPFTSKEKIDLIKDFLKNLKERDLITSKMAFMTSGAYLTKLDKSV